MLDLPERCLIVGESVSGGGDFLVSVDIVANDDYRVLVLPQTQVRFRTLRFEAVAYPVEVYRVVLVYRSGGEESLTVSWRFADGRGHRDIALPGNREVREVRMYYRPINSPRDRGNRDRAPDDRRDRNDDRGRGTFRVYGVR